MKKILSLVVVSIVFLTACEVSEGEGGTSSISGVINELQYNDDYSLLIATNPAMDKNVYIIYGDEKAVSDQVETGPDGYFEFPYLFEGNYTIFYYSDDREQAGEEIVIEHSVVLGDNDDNDMGELNCYEHLDYDDGMASVSGKVYEIQYTKNSYWPNLVAEDTIMTTEKEVYLTYGDHVFYDERVRTQEDGSFYFQNLIPGEYKIVVYGEDEQGTDQQMASTRSITISENTDEVHLVEDIYIANMK